MGRENVFRSDDDCDDEKSGIKHDDDGDDDYDGNNDNDDEINDGEAEFDGDDGDAEDNQRPCDKSSEY